MEIHLGKGVDNLIFGISENDVIKKLGKPDKIYSPYEHSKTYQYNDLLLELTFEDENDRLLRWIEVSNPNASLFGKKLIGQNRESVLDFLSGYIKDTIEEEDYGSFVSMTYEKHWLELQFKFNRLSEINIGVLYAENGEPLWPE